jgi:hypothetical protein
MCAVALPSWATGCAAGDPVSDASNQDQAVRPLITMNENGGIAFHYFVSKGLSEVQAAGIVGNLYQESLMNPAIWEYNGGPGRGIAQWSAGGRWDKDWNDNVVWYASTHGADPWSLQTQLDFIWYELTTFGFGFDDLKAAEDVTTATLVFMSQYEICGACASQNRVAYAKAALAAFGGAATPAEIALDNVGNTACGQNSIGGYGFGTSCTGNGGQPEYWCSDFVKWVWAVAGADVEGLTAAAGTFYTYGEKHDTLSDSPHVGDAVVFNYQGNAWADHVAIVTEVHDDGKIVTVSGDWNGKSGSQAYFASTASVVVNKPAFPGYTGAWAGPVGMTISGFISPVGIPTKAPPATPKPPPGPEGSQAYLYPNEQHYLNRDAAGNVRHHWWSGATKKIKTDTWGTAVAGPPVAFSQGSSQHVFARATNGSLQHWFWDPTNGPGHDEWAPGGSLAGDPAAIAFNGFQGVWGVDGKGKLQHWYWGPKTGGVQHDTWGSGVVGRPSVFVTKSGDQHAFARGTGGNLEHWWWSQANGVQHDTWATGLAGDPAALALGDFQAVWAVDGAGKLQHWYWGPKTGGVKHDTWGSGAAGRPSVFVTSGGDQHAFARGPQGTVEHWWWSSGKGRAHDTWGAGIAEDPTGELVSGQQHVWAVAANGHALHWFWDPSTGNLAHDDWGQ